MSIAAAGSTSFPALHPSSGPRSPSSPPPLAPPPPPPACEEWLHMNYINQQQLNRSFIVFPFIKPSPYDHQIFHCFLPESAFSPSSSPVCHSLPCTFHPLCPSSFCSHGASLLCLFAPCDVQVGRTLGESRQSSAEVCLCSRDKVLRVRTNFES
ncbi:zinc finger protein JAGGED-like [Plectropomus leopardus]|uniref:zinc finger protein JAGGED-like n=1 Tax=Plectropomus leopardus TaxID=160734 RepID=UPI001C4ABBB2|nr:zinc finger protein JAGGED-like [Plectropomus leopardus]